MNVYLIVAHPNPGSFNHAISVTCGQTLQARGHRVFYHDLYAEKFSPLLPFEEIEKQESVPDDVKQHCREISEADGIIIVHPNWWGMPPAILKGWIDRVFRPGVAYQFKEGDQGEGIPQGLLKATAALVFNTSNTSHEREMRVFKDPLEILWKNCIFDLCGVPTFYRKTYSVIITSTAEQRKLWLEEVSQMVRRVF